MPVLCDYAVEDPPNPPYEGGLACRVGNTHLLIVKINTYNSVAITVYLLETTSHDRVKHYYSFEYENLQRRFALGSFPRLNY